MSTAPENEFDLEKLFLPAWAQEPSAAKYAKYEGGEDIGDRRDERRGGRPLGRDRRAGPRRDGKRTRDERPGARAPGEERPRRRREERPGPGRPGPRERREPPAPLPELDISLLPDEHGVESLSRQIKMTGRAYPLFDIAQMILQKPERHSVVFSVKKNAEGQPIQPLFVCALDDSLWLSEDEAIAHVLRKHFATFYQAERTATEPPKGKYTFVAQCGMSGTILGPPNYHDYQNQLRKLHADRYARVPFEVYKSRVKIVRDEAVVKKWVDDQSWKTEYVCLNLPEPLHLGNMEAVEKHFRETHKDNIIKSVESHSLGGVASRALRSPELLRCLRSSWEDQRRFPLQIATVLSQQFAAHGLQFFKVNKTITHVSVARPHYLDLEATPVSEGVKRIVDFINANPKCNRRLLVESLAPSPVPVSRPQTEGQSPPAAESNQPTPEQTAVIADLHWLIHQGHVIEFANGHLETAKKPIPRPPKPAPKAPAPVQLDGAPEADGVAEAPEAAAVVVGEETAFPGGTPAPDQAPVAEGNVPTNTEKESAKAEPERDSGDVASSETSQSPASHAPVESSHPVASPS